VATTAQKWKVVVVVEDDTDGKALAELVRRSGLPIALDWLPANGIGNIKRKGGRLIQLARSRFGAGAGCVAVLVDRDGKDARKAEPHRTIRRDCASHGAAYVEAVESLEAWFLADPAIAEWLGLKQHGSVDAVKDPKQVVAAAFYKQTRRTYQRRRSRQQVAQHASGIEPMQSTSWRNALALLQPCLTGAKGR